MALITQLNEKEMLRLKNELKSWKNRYHKLQQIFRLQEEIIASYEAAYGEAPGLIEEDQPAERVDDSFFKMMEKRSYNQFNQEQKAAITYDMEKNLRIIAGAGSGKTQTICAKAVYLMTQKQVAEQRILMITFTRNAANELKKRVDNFSQHKTAVHIGTFHSIFFRLYNEICKEFPDIAMQGIHGDFSKDSGQKIGAILQQLIRKYNLYSFDQYGEKNLPARLDYWQNMNLSQEEIIHLVKEKFDGIEKNANQPLSERIGLLMTELKELKQQQHLADFNDILQNLKEALLDENVRQFVGKKYDFLFIDEFQDTNPLQWAVVKLITKGTNIKLVVVGDDDQSIYGFRGSEPAYIKEFEQEYPTETLFLLTNYRSRAAIVQGANRLISYNKGDRIPKAMIPAQKEAGVMEAISFKDLQAESQWVIRQVQTFIKQKGKYKESIILYRSLSQTQRLVQNLLQTDIPFVLEADAPYEGIFGVRNFQQLYRRFLDWHRATTSQKKEQSYQQILRQIMINCYLKKSECDRFFSQKQSDTDLTAYIVQMKPSLKSRQKEVEQLVKELQGFTQQPRKNMYQFWQLFMNLPRAKKELEQSERDWLIEEIKKQPTLLQLIELEKSIQSQAKQLKTRLIAYRQGKLDALCIQSIHKSKGLSYRNVFLIGCNEGALPHNGAAEKGSVSSEQIKIEPVTTIEEERRLFYVAMTRARNRLYLCVPQMKGTRQLKPSRFIKESGIQLRK